VRKLEDQGVERSRVDGSRLLLAVQAVQAKEGLSLAAMSRATGVARPTLTIFMRGGKLPGGNDIIALLGWMHMDPALVLLPAQPKQAEAEPEPGPEDEPGRERVAVAAA
jgi:transcriptional regulator with XRE-family HTH domain